MSVSAGTSLFLLETPFPTLLTNITNLHITNLLYLSFNSFEYHSLMGLNSKSSVVLQGTRRNVQNVIPMTIARRHHKKVISVQRLMQSFPKLSACAGGIIIRFSGSLPSTFFSNIYLSVCMCMQLCV